MSFASDKENKQQQQQSIFDQKSTFSIPDVGNIDFNKLAKPLTSSTPDYIPTPSARGRDIFQRLFFNTGGSFLVGYVSGGFLGGFDGYRNAANPSFRIKLNGVINGMSRNGSRLGNSLGIIGKWCCDVVTLWYNIPSCDLIGFLHTSFIGLGDAVDLDARSGYLVTPTLAGVATGALFASIRGRRAATLAGVIGGVVSTVLWYGGASAYSMYVSRKDAF